jgi:hypothetical protein
MVQARYDSKDLRNYRAAGAALAAYRQATEERLEVAAATGDVAAARNILAEATLKTEEFEKLRKQLGPIGIFLAKYGVEVINEHTILFVLPKGCSRIDILNEAQGLVRQRDDRDLIYPDHLKRWQREDRFTNSAAASERICIDGHVKGGDAKDRATQERLVAAKELSLPSIEDLAVAFALHWVATVEPLFGWYDQINGWCYYVRGAGGSLYFYHDGLVAAGVYADRDNRSVAVAARVSPESK